MLYFDRAHDASSSGDLHLKSVKTVETAIILNRPRSRVCVFRTLLTTSNALALRLIGQPRTAIEEITIFIY